MKISLENILHSLPLAVLILDADGTVIHGNRQAAGLLGLPFQALTGQSLQKLWPSGAAEVMAVVRSRRQAAGLTLPELEGCFIQCSPLTGDVPGTILTIFDDRLWQPYLGSHQALDPLTPYLRTMFESSSDGFSVSDNQGRLVLVNQAAADNVGVKPETLLGKHVAALIDQNMTSDVLSLDVIREKKPLTRLIKHYVTNKQILTTGTPIFNSEGDVHLVVLNERDITALTRLRTSFEQQKEVLAKFKAELNALQLAELERHQMVAESPAMKLVLGAAIKLAHHDVGQILVTGESGTGKGLLAKFIHARSQRQNAPFTHINCAALPESLLEAELFGYERGAFTGAAPGGRAGLFEITGTGTVFLDEIGELPLALQAKILTFLDNREFRRIGGHESLKASCAIIAATNQNLEKLAEMKKFRSDLFFRLSTFHLHIPPLRDRPEDAVELAAKELASLNLRYGQKRYLDALSLEIIQSYTFPGNVRELLSCLSRAVLLSDSPFIGSFLKKTCAARGGGQTAPPPAAFSGEAPAEAALSGRPAGLRQSLEDAERKRLEEALTKCRSTREMAVLLGISQAGVSRRLKKFSLTPPNPPKAPGRSRGD